MTNSVDPDQMASSEAIWSGSTLFDPDQMASSEAIWSGSTLFARVGVVVNWIYTVCKGRGCREQQDKG